jgi:hypothetical protein
MSEKMSENNGKIICAEMWRKNAARLYRAKYCTDEPEKDVKWSSARKQVYENFSLLLEDIEDCVEVGMFTESEYLAQCDKIKADYANAIIVYAQTTIMMMHMKDLDYWKSSTVAPSE